MKKTPSALKWLAESRGRIAHMHRVNHSILARLELQTAMLTSELRRTEKMLEKTQEKQLKLDAELKALDQTVQIFDERLDPTNIEPIRGWKGRYGSRGALREYWAAAGFKDTLLRWSMKLEIANGNEKAIQPGVQG